MNRIFFRDTALSLSRDSAPRCHVSSGAPRREVIPACRRRAPGDRLHRGSGVTGSSSWSGKLQFFTCKTKVLHAKFCILLLCLCPPHLTAATLAEGGAHYARGAYQDAATVWEAALEQTDEAEPRFELSLRLAEVYQLAGRHADAEKWLAEAETALAATDTPTARIRLYSRQVEMHLVRQHSEEAQQVLEQLPSFDETRDPALQSLMWNTQGNVARFLEYYDIAVKSYRRAAETAATDLARARAWVNAAAAAWRARRNAAELLRQAVAAVRRLPPGHLRLQEEVALADLALRQDPQLAWEILREAESRLEHSADRRLHAYVYGYLGRLYEIQERHEEALHLTNRAWFLSQDDDGLGYLWLWQRGRILQAQGRPEAAAGAYRDALTLLQPIRIALFNGRRNAREVFREDIQPVYYGLADVLLQQAASSADGPRRTEWLKQTRSVLEWMKATELQNYFQDECVTAQQRRVAGYAASLPARAAVLYPVLLPDRTEVLVEIGDDLHQVNIAAPAAQIIRLTDELRRNLQARTRWDFIAQGRALYDILVAPLQPLLAEHGVDTLVWVPDGVLRMVPPAVMVSDAERFLVQDFALVTTPALDLTEITASARDVSKILLVGLSDGVQGFEPLPAVQQEVTRIGTLYPNPTRLFNQEFVLDAVSGALRENPYSIVHVASHGEFLRDAEKSFLLTYDSKLTMNQLDRLLRRGSAAGHDLELLTLSACKTAVGDDRAALGLAGVAIKAGARSALASLWYVNDDATSELVVEFYRHLQNPELSKAQALQKAQQKLIDDRRFNHPAFWAPFLLIGNWL